MQSIATNLARKAFWPYKGQDRHLIHKLNRVTPNWGATNVYAVASELLRKPINDKLTHYYILPSMDYTKYNAIALNSQRNAHYGNWVSLQDHYEESEIEIELYTYTGVSIPISMVYYRIMLDGVMIFALVDGFEKCTVNPLVDDIYVRFYDNIYYSSGMGDKNNYNTFAKQISAMSEAAALVDIQNASDPQKIVCLQNGYLIDNIDVARTSLGDHLSLMQDESIVHKDMVNIQSLPKYYSNIDSCEKYVYCVSNAGEFNNEQRYFYDDVKFYLYNTVQKKGLKLHTNQKSYIMNLTHNMFAINSNYLNDICSKKGFNINDCQLVTFLRKDIHDVPAFGTTLCLHDLYYNAVLMGSNVANNIAQIVTSNSSIAQWRASNMESGVLVSFMDKSYLQTDTDIKALVGYHSLFEINGYSTTQYSRYTPHMYSDRFTAALFDNTGSLQHNYNNKANKYPILSTFLGENAQYDFNIGTIPNSTYVKYYPYMKESIHSVVNAHHFGQGVYGVLDYHELTQDTGLYDTHLSGVSIGLPQHTDYRIYINPTKIDEFWSEATQGLHYTISNNQLTWLINTNNVHTCIRSSQDGYCLHGSIDLSNTNNISKFQIPYTPKILNGFAGPGSLNLGSGYIRRAEDVMWGSIHVYINSKRLIENVDYYIDRANAQVVLSSVIDKVNQPVMQYSIYCFSFADENQRRHGALEFGVIYNGVLSNDRKYDSFKRRNCSIVVDNKTLPFNNPIIKVASDLDQDDNITNAHLNGRFYLIEDDYYDISHMYQTDNTFDAYDSMKQEQTFRQSVSDAMESYRPSPAIQPGFITSKNPVVSVFLSNCAVGIINNTIPVNSVFDPVYYRALTTNMFNDEYNMDVVRKLTNTLKEFEGNIEIYPTYFKGDITLSRAQFNCLSKIVNLFVENMTIHDFFNVSE